MIVLDQNKFLTIMITHNTSRSNYQPLSLENLILPPILSFDITRSNDLSRRIVLDIDQAVE